MDDNATNYDTNESSADVDDCDSESVITFQYYAWGVSANIVTCYGIVANLLSILVLRHRQMRNSTSYYLISLAVYDTLILLSMTLFLALPTIYLEKNVLESYYFAYSYMHPFVYPMALIAQTGAVYTTLAFTVERYIAVCRPLHAANTCTMSRTKRVILVIFLASVTYNIPRFLEFRTTHEWDSSKNRTIPIISPTEIGENQLFKEVYFIYAYLVIMFLLPFSLLTILNILLIRAVNRARAKRNSISSSSIKETNLTVMLIVVINVFLGCQLPALIDNILVAIVGQETLNCSASWVRFTTISNLLIVFNSAINFILYCALGKRFRRVFLKMFGSKPKKPQFKYTVQLSQQSSVYRKNTCVNGYVTKVVDMEGATSSLL